MGTSEPRHRSFLQIITPYCLLLPLSGTFFVISFFSSAAFADISTDLSDLLEIFHGGGSERSEAWMPVPDIDFTESTEYEVPKDPKGKDLTEVQMLIFEAEAQLRETESALRSLESLYQNTQEKADQAREDLFVLEEEKEKVQAILKENKRQRADLKVEIKRLTQEKSLLRGYFREIQKQYQSLVLQQYHQNHLFGGGKSLRMLQWVLSDSSLSDHLQQEKRRNHIFQELKSFRQQLFTLRDQYETKERALLLHMSRQASLVQRQERQLRLLLDMEEGRAGTLQKAYDTDLQDTQMISHLRAEQAKLTVRLTHLRESLQVMRAQLTAQGEDVSQPPQAPYVWPIEGPFEISATFHDPVYEETLGRVHEGVDFAIPKGTNVRSMAEGVVEKAHHGGYGYSYVLIRQRDGRLALYGHLSQILVNTGDTITQGQSIALSGGVPGDLGTGVWSTGPHLHVGLFNAEGFLDVLKFLPGSAE